MLGRVILLTPVKSNLKNPVSDCQVFSSAPFCCWPHHLYGVKLHTLTLKAGPDPAQLRRGCWWPSTGLKGLEINGAGSARKLGFPWWPAWFFPPQLPALQGRLLCPIWVHMKLMKSQRNIFHTSYCVLATVTYMLLVKYWLRLFQGGGERVPFTCLIYMSNIKLKWNMWLIAYKVLCQV